MFSCGDIVVMDDLSSHEDKGVGEVIDMQAPDCIIGRQFPPDLYSIEPTFSKFKKLRSRPRAGCRVILRQVFPTPQVTPQFRIGALGVAE